MLHNELLLRLTELVRSRFEPRGPSMEPIFTSK